MKLSSSVFVLMVLGFCIMEVGADCRTQGCQHGCQDTPGGAACQCNVGYKLHTDGVTCVDSNECENEPCSQLCDNTEGSFTCRCVEYYTLAPDGVSCRAAGASPTILYSSDNEIHGRFLRGQGSREEHMVVKDTGRVSFMAFDSVDSILYWSDNTDHHVWSSSLDGTDRKHVLSQGLGSPEGLDIDWISRNLYFVDAKRAHIGVCKLDRGMCAVIVDRELHKPRGLALDPIQRRMFWSDWGDHPKIESAFLDGSHQRTLVSDHIVWPNGVACDHWRQTVYWVDSKLDLVGSVSYSGENRREYLKHEVHHPFSIAIFEDSMFVVDLSSSWVMSANKLTGGNLTSVVSHATDPHAVIIVHPALQSIHENPCQYHSCSHICLPSAVGIVCKCPVGFTLDADGTTCHDAVTSNYLLVASEHNLLKIFPESIGNRPDTLFQSLQVEWISSLAFDWSTKTLFYSDHVKSQVVKAELSGAKLVNSDMIISGEAEFLAVDWVAKNLYMASSITGHISISRFDGGSLMVLRQYAGFRPRAIALNPPKGQLFYTDIGDNSRIDACGLEVNNCYIVVDRLGWPNALTLDTVSDQLYWVDSKFETVETVNVHGQRRKTLSARAIQHCFSLALLHDMLYIADWFKSLSILNTTGGYLRPLLSADRKVSGVIAISPQQQNGTNDCAVDNGGCSNLCIYVPYSAPKCLCPLGMILDKDGSNCVFRCISPNVACDNGTLCIDNDDICDGSIDCQDRSDESHDMCRLKMPCSSDEFECTSMFQCVSLAYVCDRDSDCHDGSDEYDCKPTPAVNCTLDEFHCADDVCVPKESVCDGVEDCRQGDDEARCTATSCTDRFNCGNGQCVPDEWVCDTQEDCNNGADEPDSCVFQCLSSQWRCDSGQCTSAFFRCDGAYDCEDQSDEVNCTKTTSTTCSDQEFACAPGGPCIERSMMCDGNSDCLHGTDESQQLCRSGPVTCAVNEFLCVERVCIPADWVCDGMDDCVGGEDEQLVQCLPSVVMTMNHVTGDCESEMYQCSAGDCLPLTSVCDGRMDCIEGSDEGGACELSCVSRNGGCSQTCTPTPRGPVCSCYHGYRLLSDGMSCEDIDECASDRMLCSQTCVNHKGGYRCSCYRGYLLTSDGETCKATGEEPNLVFSNYNQLRFTSIAKEHYGLISENVKEHYISLDFYWTSHVLYMSDITQRAIVSLSFPTKSPDAKPLFKDLQVNGLAVDWIVGNIFMTQTWPKVGLKACSVNSLLCQFIATENIDQPLAVAVNPLAGLVFWSEVGSYPRIESSWMNGANRRILVDSKISWPTGITIDVTSSSLFWVDTKLNKLERCDVDGGNRVRLAGSSVVGHPYSVSVFEDAVFWTDWKSGIISKANKRTGNNATVVLAHLRRPMDLQVVHPSLQLSASNHCATIQPACTHLCFLTPVGARCSCPIGYSMQNGSCQILQQVTPSIAFDSINFPVLPNSTDVFRHMRVTCLRNICHNEGICYHMVTGQSCDCPTNYTGLLCEVSPPTGTVDTVRTLSSGLSSVHTVGIVVTCVLLVIVVIFATLYFCKWNGHRYNFLRQVARFHRRATKGGDTEDAERLVFETYHAGQSIDNSPEPVKKSEKRSSLGSSELSTTSQTDVTTDPEMSTDSSESPRDVNQLLPGVHKTRRLSNLPTLMKRET